MQVTQLFFQNTRNDGARKSFKFLSRGAGEDYFILRHLRPAKDFLFYIFERFPRLRFPLFNQQGIIKVLPDLLVLLNINKDCLFLTSIINYELYAFHHFDSFALFFRR